MVGTVVSDTHTVVVEIKLLCTKNVVIHTENCKLDLPLDCSTTQMEKNITMCGIEESSRRRGFADFALEVFYINFIEAGSSRKAPFFPRTKDQWEMFQKSPCTSLSVRVIQRKVTFQRGSVNIVLQENSPPVQKLDDPQPFTSLEIQPGQESAEGNTSESEGQKRKLAQNASTAERIAVTDKRHLTVERWRKN